MESGEDFHEESKKTHEHRNRDLISGLPDELIIQIISLMEMKDAVKTGTLSKRWKKLWTYTDSIVFKYHSAEESEPERIISFIDHSLMQCICPSLKKLTLIGCQELSLDKSWPDLLVKWLKYVLNKNLESLTLKNLGTFYWTSDRLYQCSSLVNMELHYFDLSESSRVSWTSLKSLSLETLWLEGEFMENILLGCPVLESLVLDAVEGIQHLNIMSQSVKKLILRNFGNEDYPEDKLKIKAPWLKELEVSGWFFAFLQLVDVSSLENAALIFITGPEFLYDMWIKMVTGVFYSSCNVGELLIGSQLIQVFSLLDLLGKPRPLLNCKHMRVNSPLWKYDLPGIVCVLECAPNLETLIIEVSEWQDGESPFRRTKVLFRKRDPHLSMPNRTFMHIKNVKIDYMRSSCSESGVDREVYFDFELVGYILRSAIVLEKLVICSSRPHCDGCKMKCKYHRVRLLSSKLLTSFPVGNKGAGWEYRKEKYSFEFTSRNS